MRRNKGEEGEEWRTEKRKEVGEKVEKMVEKKISS